MSVYVWAERLLLWYQIMNGLVSGKAVDVTSENNRHQQSSLFWFLDLLSVHLKSLVIIIEMGDDLGWNNIQRETWRKRSLTNMMRVKGSERRPFSFISRLNIIQRDSYQTDEIVMEIEEWKQKVADDYVKSFSRVLLGVLETSILS